MLPSTSIFSKALTIIKTLSSKKLFSSIASYDDKFVDWLMKGLDHVKDNHCPFCEKKMSSLRIKKLKRIKEMDSENIIHLKKELNSHASLIINTLEFHYFKMKIIEEEIISFVKAVDIYAKIHEQVDSMFNYDHTKFAPIQTNSDFSKHFPESSKAYNRLCKNIPKLVEAIKKTHEETDKFLKYKKGIINNEFEKAGVPYRFEVKYQRSGPNEYYIVHKNNSDNVDNRKCLSEGEKAIVTLILFLKSACETNYKIYMIDDPVSSFDNLRRKYIYNLIRDSLKNKTVLVLSHDAVFAKFAIEDASKNYIGDVSYLSNNGKNSANVISIKGKELKKFNQCVINKFETATCQYQKAVLIRLLIEDEYGKHSKKYSYLSKIIHGCSYSEIMSFLSKKGKLKKMWWKKLIGFLTTRELNTIF